MMRVDISRLRFLIIDDNTYVRRIIRVLLHGFGAREVLEAEDGPAGLESFNLFNPDIVIVDWEMPILDGIEVVRMLRDANSSRNAFVPIIMCTAHSEMVRVVQARDAGITEFLAKPISAKSLYQRIVNAVVNPRTFVRTANYFGPDRRRATLPDYSGQERRKDILAAREAAQRDAANTEGSFSSETREVA
ncbi:MAG: two-component system response regulator [Rhizobiales bacterium 65-9]|nr:response regulator [Hyphomicrobiales bacterium]OJY32454.1 MAG: two-component system response regulator [Rhizobiales bacterium 65-9]